MSAIIVLLMQKKYLFGVMAVVMFASIVAISIGTNMKADAQNPTTSEEAG